MFFSFAKVGKAIEVEFRTHDVNPPETIYYTVRKYFSQEAQVVKYHKQTDTVKQCWKLVMSISHILTRPKPSHLIVGRNSRQVNQVEVPKYGA